MLAIHFGGGTLPSALKWDNIQTWLYVEIWESHQGSWRKPSRCRIEYTHLVFYFYCELSAKEGEKARRAEEAIGIINVMAIAEEIPIPQKIEKFWASSKNKENIQQFLLVK